MSAITTVSAADNAISNVADAWRKSPPTLPSPRAFKLPNVVTYKLDNGLTVRLVEDHRVPFITVFLGIKTGSALEPVELTGLAALTADMITEGTKGRTSRQIAEEIDFIGGALKGASDYDFTLISGSALAKYKNNLFDVMSDVVLHPSFPADELKLKKTNLIQELVVKRSQPDFLQDEQFHKVVFGAHPYAIV
ncbi:MAG: insulinase family protein, partial [Candidatus Melainabacteria bacterium]|nr:insulinase family protein [Candidatus Melainabacteria bacterium]